MPNVIIIIIKKSLALSNLSLFESEVIKKKINHFYGFMPSNFQVIFGSMVSKNHWFLVSTETPEVLLW